MMVSDALAAADTPEADAVVIDTGDMDLSADELAPPMIIRDQEAEMSQLSILDQLTVPDKPSKE